MAMPPAAVDEGSAEQAKDQGEQGGGGMSPTEVIIGIKAALMQFGKQLAADKSNPQAFEALKSTLQSFDAFVAAISGKGGKVPADAGSVTPEQGAGGVPAQY